MTAKSSPAESFDSTARLMLEALAKASAELEKSVTGFTEQLISFNDGLQKSFEEEVRAVNARLEASLHGNIDELGHTKHLMMKRLLEAERTELDGLSVAGRQVRAALSAGANQIEKKLETFIANQINELKEFLQEPQERIERLSQKCTDELDDCGRESSTQMKAKQDEFRRQLSDKVSELERNITLETERAREAIKSQGDLWTGKLHFERETFANDLTKLSAEIVSELDSADLQGGRQIDQSEQDDKAHLNRFGEVWKGQIDSHTESFHKLIASIDLVLKENFDTKLANATEQARQEISALARQAQEKIAGTRSELEVELHSLEKEYVQKLEATLEKLESVVSEHSNDKRNGGAARQHKAQKLRDQMQTHLRRFGSSLVDSIKDAAVQLENEFNHATDGFQVRIEGSRSAAIELLERETKLMQKDLDRVLKDFQRELGDFETQINKIENAGQDAVVTVIACRKAMLSFKGE